LGAGDGVALHIYGCGAGIVKLDPVLLVTVLIGKGGAGAGNFVNEYLRGDERRCKKERDKEK
jgi:hypothetical protein